MTDITIPRDVLEAAAIDLHKAVYDGPDELTWADTDEQTRNHFRRYARAACLAMLRAWPGMEQIYRSEDQKLFTIILPLTTENTND